MTSVNIEYWPRKVNFTNGAFVKAQCQHFTIRLRFEMLLNNRYL